MRQEMRVNSMDTLAHYIGWAWIVFIPATMLVSFTVFIPYWFCNRAWKDWRNAHGWKGFKKVVRFYRKHHDGKLPKNMENMQ